MERRAQILSKQEALLELTRLFDGLGVVGEGHGEGKQRLRGDT